MQEFLHDDYLACFLWWAAALNVGIWLFLGCTTRLWLGSSDPSEALDRSKHWRWMACAAMGLAGWLAAPRLAQSLWDDEQHSALEFVHGQWGREMDDAGQVQQSFGKVSWWDTALAYRDPNNHPLFSVAARLSLAAWRWLNDKQAYEFHEVAFRFPAFVLGLLALPAWGWLARVFGLRRGAVLLMFLLAVHPWFVRYISEGRGHAFVLLGLPLWLGSASQAMRTGQWGWWLRMALWQVFLLLSWPGTILPVVAVQLAWLLLIVRGSRRRFFAWGAANLLSLGLFLQWFLPCIFQCLHSDFEYPQHAMSGGYVVNFLSHLLMGTVWSAGPLDPPDLTHFLPLSQQNPWQVVGSVALMLGLVLLALRGWNASRSEPLLRTSFAAAGIAVVACLALGMWFTTRGQMPFLFDWYFLWWMPWIYLLVSRGLESLSLSPWLLLPLCLIFLRCERPFLQRLRTFPIQPMRESVLAMRASTSQDTPDRNTVLTAHLNQMATLYDPHGYEVTEMQSSDAADPGLRDLMQRAQAEHKTLFVNVGFPRAARLNYPALMQMVDQPALFESIAVLPGQELGLSHEIFRYHPPTIP